jgi:uncharacterized membrane-anchored protein
MDTLTPGRSEPVARNDERSPNRVPAPTALFWVVKVLTTGMGETASDFLFQNLAAPVALGLGLIGLVAALTLQFRACRYVPWRYWFAVVMISVFGTMAADVVHVGLGVPYVVSAASFLVILGLIFVIWRRTERTLSIHSIQTGRRERYYWATVLATFALGTAVGDLTARTFHFGYLASAIVFLAVIAIPAPAQRWLRLNAVAAFWIAYVITRPLGASFADWFAVAEAEGGLNWGTGAITATLTVIIVALVALLTVLERRVAPVADGPA